MGENSNIIDGVTIVNPKKVSIGDKVSIHPYTYILGEVTIGNYVGIASKCSIIAETHNTADISIPYKMQGIEDQPVSIGNDVWIGAHSIILGNSIIGDGVIISAGSVVSGEIPPYSVVMGNPARVYFNRKKSVFNKKIGSNESRKTR
jgi:acetyltransferase-like isoleucine patch superfamily enzyme